MTKKQFYTAISRCTALNNVYCKSYPKRYFKEEVNIVHRTEGPRHTKFSESKIYKITFLKTKDGKRYIGSTIKTLD